MRRTTEVKSPGAEKRRGTSNLRPLFGNQQEFFAGDLRFPFDLVGRQNIRDGGVVPLRHFPCGFLLSPIPQDQGRRAGKLLVPEGYAAEIVVEYFAVPNTIPQDAPDSCEFEIDAEACECMPYYVAAQQLLPDLVLDYGAMLQMYDRAAARLSAALPGGNRRVAQSLFRR